jgi:hypothetical protein
LTRKASRAKKKLPGVKQVEDAKGMALEVEKELKRQETVQQAAKEVLNLPDVFEVNGKRLEVKSKSLEAMGYIDEIIFDLGKIAYRPIELFEELPDFRSNNPEEVREFAEKQMEIWEKLRERNRRFRELIGKALFYILNDNYENPEVDLDWINKNIDCTANGVGVQIIRTYTERNSLNPIIQTLLGARRF